jgi:uncharacterized membrane protein
MGQTHVTLATATGLVRAALLVHVGAGVFGLVTGFVAVFATKGRLFHRKSGMIFVYAMITMGLVGLAIATYEGKVSSMIGGLFTAYLVFTAMTAARPLEVETRSVAASLMVLAFSLATADFTMGIRALGQPMMMVDGVPAPMIFFMGSVALVAGVGDLRLMLAGGIRGARRIARHSWRMCFALFVASGSFFLGQMRFFPSALRVPWLLAIPSFAPLVLLFYWMWRLRVRGRLPMHSTDAQSRPMRPSSIPASAAG